MVRAAYRPRLRGRGLLLGGALLLLAATLPLSAQASLVILVRHAEKATGGDDPGLTMEGWTRAEALVKALSCVKLDGVITTRYQRTRLTAAPVVKAQQLEPVEVAASRDITAHAAEVASLVNAMPAGSAVLIVGHSNTLAPIIAALGGPAIVERPSTTASSSWTGAAPPPRPAGARPLRCARRAGGRRLPRVARPMSADRTLLAELGIQLLALAIGVGLLYGAPRSTRRPPTITN